MELKPTGGIHQRLSVRDEAGNQYACPQVALNNPEHVGDEEKEHCILEKAAEEGTPMKNL